MINNENIIYGHPEQVFFQYKFTANDRKGIIFITRHVPNSKILMASKLCKLGMTF